MAATYKRLSARFERLHLGFGNGGSPSVAFRALASAQRRKGLRGSVILAVALGAAACGLPKRELESKLGVGGSMSLAVNTASNANQDSPVALDIVEVSDKKLLPTLAKLTANQWFEKRSQILLDHPGSIEVLRELELVPGERYGPVKFKPGAKFVGGILYADYFTPGAHRAVVDIRKPLVIDLLRDNFAIRKDK